MDFIRHIFKALGNPQAEKPEPAKHTYPVMNDFNWLDDLGRSTPLHIAEIDAAAALLRAATATNTASHSGEGGNSALGGVAGDVLRAENALKPVTISADDIVKIKPLSVMGAAVPRSNKK